MMPVRFKKLIPHCIVLLLLLAHAHTHTDLTSLAKNDAYPVFTSVDPQSERFLLMCQLLDLKDADFADEKGCGLNLSISPYGQNANWGRNIRGEQRFGGVEIQLGDIVGRWGTIPLLFGAVPEGKTLPPVLQEARDNLFPGVTGIINDVQTVDPLQLFGYFTIPLEYRKRGVRFSLSAYMGCGFGINVEAGVASIRQTVGDREKTICLTEPCVTADPQVFAEWDFFARDLTDLAHPAFVDMSGLTTTQVQQYLTSKIRCIADEIGLDICDFCATSAEEVRVNLFWRWLYELNKGREEHWPHVAVMPFLIVSGSISPGKRTDRTTGGPFFCNQEPGFTKQFAVPFGNNDHSAVGFSTGLNFDFISTIQIGAEVGVTHFFNQTYENFRVPTSKFQTGIFPFATDVEVSPGINWHFILKMYAYHFLEHLSMYFQYVMVEHKEDHFTLKKPDPAFLPGELTKISSWKTKMANVSFTYDISPNIGLGFFWQAPLMQRNTYRSTTLMFTFNATF